MIAVWNKETKAILHQTMDISQAVNYELFAHQKNVGLFFNPDATAFPEPGFLIDQTSGEYRPMTYVEKVNARLEPALQSNQKIVKDSNGNERAVPMSEDEQLKAGIITLLDIKSRRKTILYMQATEYLNASTTQSGYSTSDTAQKIALNSIQMKNVADNDVDKKALADAGLIYSLEKSREILTFCAAVTASFREACKSVDSALNVAQITSVKLDSYL